MSIEHIFLQRYEIFIDDARSSEIIKPTNSMG